MTFSNELIFLLAIFFVGVFGFIAKRLGKEFLLVFMVLQGLLANIFLMKEISFFGCISSAGDIFIVGISLAVNLLEEFFGKEAAQRAIDAYIFSAVAFAFFCVFQLAFIATPGDVSDVHFKALFGQTPMIVFTGICVSFFTLNFDRAIYRLLTNFLDARFLPLKNFIATAGSQFFDTVLFTWLATAQFFSDPWQVILVSYCIKLFCALLLVPVLMGFWFLNKKS